MAKNHRRICIFALSVTMVTVGLFLDFLYTSGFTISPVAMPLSHKMFGPSSMSNEDISNAGTISLNDDYSVAKSLYANVRVLCWVMTSPDNLEKKAVHVTNTWAKRCNTVLFMSSVTNETFPTVGLNIAEGREHLTGKTMLAFRYVYDHHFGEADWFLKADDDTNVVLENLRYFLSGEGSEEPIFFGQHFNAYIRNGYFTGGAGYVLSKEALRRLYRDGKKTLSTRRKWRGHKYRALLVENWCQAWQLNRYFGQKPIPFYHPSDASSW